MRRSLIALFTRIKQPLYIARGIGRKAGSWKCTYHICCNTTHPCLSRNRKRRTLSLWSWRTTWILVKCSRNVEYLTLSVDAITLIKLNLTAEEIKQNWLLRARHREEASRFATILNELTSVVNKLTSRTLWHPTSRMRLIQFLFHTYGIEAVAKAFKEKTSAKN